MSRLAVAGLLLGLALTRPALGGGLTYLDPGPRALARAGAVVAGIDDPTATFLNPARLVLGPDYDAMAALTLVDLRQRFARAPDPGDPTPYAAVENGGSLGLLPTAAVSARFGLDDWAFGLSVHAPNAYGQRSFPTEGAQRYQLVSTDLQVLFVSAAAAWAALPELSVGVALQLVTVPRARLAMVVDGYWLHTTHTRSGPYDALTAIDVHDPARFTATVGLSWRPRPWLELAASSQVLPVHIEATGTLAPEFLGATIASLYETGQLRLTDTGTRLDLTLPPVLRVGARLVGVGEAPDAEPWGDLELDLVYEAWSLYERIGIAFDGAFDLESAENDLPLRPLDLPRRYRDTISVRLGGGIRPGLDWLRLFGGVFYESAAAGAEHATVDATTGHRLGLGVGVAVRVGPVEATAAYLHVFELDVDVADTDIFQQRPLSACERPYDDPTVCDPVGQPSGPPVGNGRYSANLSLASFGLRARW